MEKRQILWTPSIERMENSTIHQYEKYLLNSYNLSFENYNDLWKWSIADLNVFWSSIADYFGMRFFDHPETIINSRNIMDTKWFEGAKVNFSDQMLNNRRVIADKEAWEMVTFEDIEDAPISYQQTFPTLAPA